MGQQAEFVGQEGNIYYFMKDLENGDVAISATNVGATQQQVKFDFAKFSALNVKGHYQARDCQAQKTLENEVETGFTTTVRSHATAVFRLTLKGTGVFAGSHFDRFAIQCALRSFGTSHQRRRPSRGLHPRRQARCAALMLRRGSVLSYRLLRLQSNRWGDFLCGKSPFFFPLRCVLALSSLRISARILFFPGESCNFARVIRHFRRVHL